MLDKKNRDIIALNMVPGLGPRRILSLLEGVRDTEGLFSMSSAELGKRAGGTIKWERDLRSVRNSSGYLEELSYIKNNNISILCSGDGAYPEALRCIYDPPPVLYFKGSLQRNDADAVAIVGSRRCSAYGLQMAERLAFDLAKQGITIVSGMARGIDEAAHRGAVKAGGRTIAVLGSGFRYVYPPDSERLVSLILENGAVITEFASGVEPFKGNFPRRNRIISGLAKGVVVVEAAKKSGALITADFALDQGKEVFAVPGRADFYTSGGTNRLIQNGAKLVTCAEDILEELNMEPEAKCHERPEAGCSREERLSGAEEKVIRTLDKNTPVHIDRIQESTGIDRSRLPEVLLKMEIRDFIKPLPGNTYVIAEKS
ncbi:MAG: DNA-processing protein DprA [Candidatus Omnitrophica bacterium]|nr:DNA-processing protein DprA [Candidatus Omnitrophota bacterium]